MRDEGPAISLAKAAALELSRLQAQARHNAAREAMQAEREAHQATVAAATEQAKTELEMVMAELSKSEARTVRLHAFLHVLAHGDMADPSSLQSQTDTACLRLARYVITGYVR